MFTDQNLVRDMKNNPKVKQLLEHQGFRTVTDLINIIN